MKQNIATNSPITKTDLTDVLKEYPTKTDLTNAFKEYPTKADLNKELSERLTKSENAFRREIHHEFSMMREEMRTMMSEFTNRLLTTFDPLLRELETRQQDREIATAKMRAVEGDIVNLDKRVTKLEHS